MRTKLMLFPIGPANPFWKIRPRLSMSPFRTPSAAIPSTSRFGVSMRFSQAMWPKVLMSPDSRGASAFPS